MRRAELEPEPKPSAPLRHNSDWAARPTQQGRGPGGGSAAPRLVGHWSPGDSLGPF
jgi:hypothetical protein